MVSGPAGPAGALECPAERTYARGVPLARRQASLVIIVTDDRQVGLLVERVEAQLETEAVRERQLFVERFPDVQLALLIDVGASWREDKKKLNAIFFVVAPEKVVFRGLQSLSSGPQVLVSAYAFWGGIYLASFACDFAGLGALAAALAAGVMPAPLMVGYGMVAAAAVLILLGFGGCLRRCGWQR